MSTTIELSDSDIQIMIDYARVDPEALRAGYVAMMRHVRRGGAVFAAAECAGDLLSLSSDERRALARIRDLAGRALVGASSLVLQPVRRGRGRPRRPANDFTRRSAGAR